MTKKGEEGENGGIYWWRCEEGGGALKRFGKDIKEGVSEKNK